LARPAVEVDLDKIPIDEKDHRMTIDQIAIRNVQIEYILIVAFDRIATECVPIYQYVGTRDYVDSGGTTFEPIIDDIDHHGIIDHYSFISASDERIANHDRSDHIGRYHFSHKDPGTSNAVHGIVLDDDRNWIVYVMKFDPVRSDVVKAAVDYPYLKAVGDTDPFGRSDYPAIPYRDISGIGYDDRR
jgi:hypothetical protein